MPSIFDSAFRLLPWVLTVILIAMNGWVLILSPQTMLNEEGVWAGTPLSGTPLALSDLVEEVVSPLSRGPVPQKIEEPVKKEEETKKPAEDGFASKQTVKLSDVPEIGFLVQAGSFVLDLGIESLMAELKKLGLEPHVKSVMEPIRLNDVQAGPFKNLEDAREAEAKLKAVGMAVGVEETWEGFIISLSQSPLLGYAVQDLDRARDLGVKTIRVVKINVDRPVKKVVLGPFPTKTQAKSVSAKVSKLGLAVPVIQEWSSELESAESEILEVE